MEVADLAKGTDAGRDLRMGADLSVAKDMVVVDAGVDAAADDLAVVEDGGTDGGDDGGAPDMASATGFGPCISQKDYDAQGTGLGFGFCTNFLGVFGCISGMCEEPGVDAGDIVCSPTCKCAPMPPICPSTDGGPTDDLTMGDGGVDDASATVDGGTDDGGLDMSVPDDAGDLGP